MRKYVMLFVISLSVVCYVNAQDTKKSVEIREAEFSNENIASLKAILKDADASSYNLVVKQGDKVNRLGSASIRDLKTVSAFHKPGSRASAGNEIVTTISDYVKTIYTSKFASTYPDKVKQINQLLEGAAASKTREVKLKEVNLNADELTQLKKIMADAPANTYNLVVQQGNKVNRLGSASIRDLTTVSAFHKPGSAVSAGNEIVTTISDYVKTIYTSKFASTYPDKVLQINRLMEGAANR